MPDIKKFESTRITYNSTKLETTSNGNAADKSFTEAQLREAIIAGDEKKVLSILEKGMDVNVALQIAQKTIAEKPLNPSAVEKISSLILDVAAKQIEANLYKKIDQLQSEVSQSGFEVHMGSEDEFYLHGEDAWKFKEKYEAELRKKFPLIDRVYEEADALLLTGLPTDVRLKLPGVIKLEITTKHQDDNGKPLSAKDQAELINAIRSFVVEKQKEWNLTVDFRSRPFPDIQKAAKEGTLPFSKTDAEILASLQDQMRNPASSYEHRTGFQASLMNPAKHQETLRKLEEIKTTILSAKSFDELCEKGIIVAKDVPGNGVDINTSLWKDGHNVFFDDKEISKTSPIFWPIAHAYVQLIGKETGSLLASTQSYSENTFDRMGQKRLAASALSAVTQQKGDGGNLKRSPPTTLESLFRGTLEALTEKSLRLERREGEPGGGLGYTNNLAHVQYAFTAILAVRNGLREIGILPNENGIKSKSPNTPNSWDELLQCQQPFNKSHPEALASFKSSELLKGGYGDKLHSLVANHAELAISLKAIQKDIASGVLQEKQAQAQVGMSR